MSLRKGTTLISGVGIDGQNGTNGQDGFSPSASVNKVGSISTLTVTDKNGTTTTEILDGGQIIQYPVMPTASVDNLGNIIQYTGTTNNKYTSGYFYECLYGENAPKLVVPQGAYFNLDFLPSSNTEIEVSFKSTTYVSDQAIFGCQYYNFNPEIHWSMNTFYIGTGTTEERVNNAYQNDTIYTIKWNTKNDSNQDGYVKINNDYYGSYNFNYTGSYKIYLFYYYGNAKFDGEFYYLKTIDKTTNTVTHNWIPAENDGVACIYDTITEQYLYNVGTGKCKYINEYYWDNKSVQFSPDKWRIDGDYLIYNITPGSYNVAGNGTGISSANLPTNELIEFKRLCYYYSKKPRLNIPTYGVIYSFYSTTVPTSINSGLSLYAYCLANEEAMNMVYSNLNIAYNYDSTTDTLTVSYQRYGRNGDIKLPSIKNTVAYTPTVNSYNPATAIYAEKMVESVASVYSSSSTYAIGDYVSYQGKLYVCNTTISSAEAWTSGHWTETTAMSVVGNINSVLSSLTTPNNGGN